MRAADARQPRTSLERVHQADDLAVARRAFGDEAEADRAFQMRRIGGRSDIALVMRRIDRRVLGEEMRARGDRLAVDGLQADKAQPVLGDKRLARPARTAPMLSFFAETMRAMPRFRAVMVPFSSLPVTWPFSIRITPSASVP